MWDALTMNWQGQLDVLGRIAFAGLLGGVIGWEREWARKPAGVRTQMFVAAGAALFMVLGEAIVRHFQAQSQPDGSIVSADPIRIIHAIVIGVSFLGTGTIVRRDEGGGVEGLTTAASVLLTTGIGLAVAMRQYILATGMTFLTILVLFGVRRLEARLAGKKDKPGSGKD
jgi:putative Mg2+ transporter-C (MgtC) family protein